MKTIRFYDRIVIHCKSKDELLDYRELIGDRPVEVLKLDHGYEMSLPIEPTARIIGTREYRGLIDSLQFVPSCIRYHIDHHLDNIAQAPLINKIRSGDDGYFNPLTYLHRKSEYQPKHLKAALSDLLDMLRKRWYGSEVPHRFKSSRLYKSMILKLLQQTHRIVCHSFDEFYSSTDLHIIVGILERILPHYEPYQDYSYTTIRLMFHSE
ncbi:MAG: hypothetical protein ACLFTZ_05010 [Acholeplasmataceae bacterium]